MLYFDCWLKYLRQNHLHLFPGISDHVAIFLLGFKSFRFLGVPVILGILGNIWVEVHLLDLDAALTVALMATGLEIAKLGIGRTSVTAVGREVISKRTARTVQKN